MTGNVKMSVALVGGYLLGRTKKAKLAIGFGMFLAGKKLSLDGRQLGTMLADSPLLGTLNEQVRKEVVGATKTAATNALTQRAAGLADSLRKRTLALEDPSGTHVRGREEEQEQKKDEDTEDTEDTAAKSAPRRRTAAKSAGGATSGARRATSGSARKKTASATRKATSGTRKTASSSARRDGGGSNG